MIKVVPDTNILLKGMFGYKSPERKLLTFSLLKKIQLIGATETKEEFKEKVYMESLQRFWRPKNFSPEKILLDYESLVIMHEPLESTNEIQIPIRDPEDAIFIKLALSANIPIIISEDKDLLVLDGFESLRITTAEKFISAYSKTHGGTIFTK